jgi:ABC-type anion transport system duplicated permease subunit
LCGGSGCCLLHKMRRGANKRRPWHFVVRDQKCRRRHCRHCNKKRKKMKRKITRKIIMLVFYILYSCMSSVFDDEWKELIDQLKRILRKIYICVFRKESVTISSQ